MSAAASAATHRREWMIPHFEKMLYDNGALLSVYADALAIGPDPLFEAAVRETAAWLMREMQHADGGYFSAIDADSEGEEGKFYVWRRDEIKRLLSADEYLVAETLYGLDKPANFEGKWNLHRGDAWHSVVERLAIPREAGRRAARERARQDCSPRAASAMPPAKDDKILTAWNGIAIRGMAKAGLVLGEPKWVESATRAADFIGKQMVIDAQLYATYRDGQARHPAYLDDYANLLDGLLALLQARWREADTRLAKLLADTALARFTTRRRRILLHRQRSRTVDPSAEAVDRRRDAAGQRHDGARAEPARPPARRNRYLDAASGTLKWARAAMEQYPAGHCSLLSALEDEVNPPESIIVRGPRAELEGWLRPMRSGYRPWRHAFGIPYEEVGVMPGVSCRGWSPPKNSGNARAYMCQGLACSLPIHSQEELAAALKTP